MKFSSLFFVGLILIFFVACEQEEQVEMNDLKDINGSPLIQLSNLKVGQQSNYIKLKGESLVQNENPRTTLLGETLTISVVAVEGNIYTIEEVSSNSNDDIRTFQLAKTERGVEFRPDGQYGESWLFNSFVDPFTMDLVSTFDCIAGQQGWSPTLGKETCYYAELPTFELLEKTLSNAKLYFNYDPIAYDGAGVFVIYDDNDIHRIGIFNPWTAEAEIWELLK